MTEPTKMVLFNDKAIRSHWDDEQEDWFFSVVDVVAALTDSANPTDYLKKLRKRDEQLGSYIGTNCPQVAMPTESGKLRKTLAASAQQLLRIIQSIHSKKAEPFKLWVAEAVNPTSMDEHEDVAKRGGGVAKEARIKLEAETGKKVVSPVSAKQSLPASKGKKDD